ncbi:MAG: methyltransferase domain-containing protein [Planctomycetota bacterium]|nr:methyltransferase domain-containing protein [Planctomycetota bacterium]
MAHDDRNCIRFFDGLAEHWQGLYQSKATLRDRLMLFTQGLSEVLPPPARVLDFGCGPGVISVPLASMGYDVTGVDGAPRMIELAEKERTRLGITNASFRVATADSLDIAPDSFDAVICSSVIEYVEDDTGLLAKLAEVLRPGGVLLVSVPHRDSLLGKLEDLGARITWLKQGPGRADLKYSKRRYDSVQLVAALRALSLDFVRCTFFEVPLLGSLGIRLSRSKRIGLMQMVTARKQDPASLHNGTRKKLQERQAPLGKKALSRKNLWEAAPAWLRGCLGPALNQLHPWWLLGRKFRRASRLVRHAEHWTATQLEKHQLAELRRVCILACQQTEYYRHLFHEVCFDPAAIAHSSDLRRLPAMDKDTVRKHLLEMCTLSPRSLYVDHVSTGGGSGEPLHFYLDADRSSTEYAHLVVSWGRIGYRLGMPLAVLRGRVVGKDRGGLRHEYDPLLRHHYYSSFHMSDAMIGRYVEHIAGIGPCFMHVYPSTVAALSRFLRRSGTNAPANIRGIIAESEIVYPEQRKMVEEVFGCRYFSCYGHSEKLVMAAECEHSTDYHVWPTYGYFELLDDRGNPVTTPGQCGEIVGTGFISKVMPFIRYRTGDYATYVGDRCEACGRQHTIIRDIHGHRTQEVLIAADGSQISWTALNMHDDTFLNVRQFQFYQDTPGRAALRVVPADKFGDEDQRKIQHNLGRKLDGQVIFTVELVDAISLTPRGKAVYVDQRIKKSPVDDKA